MQPTGSHEAAPLERAAFVISIDTEMAWGLNHRQSLTYRYDRERVDMARLLDLLDRYDVPATWAIVGHLMLDGCEPVDGIKHPEIIRPDFDWFEGDWFDGDPCGRATTGSVWYAPDLVAAIRAARAPHEIGTHGFSHIMAGEPGCSRATFDSEMKAAVAVAAERDLTLRSLIHPRNLVAHNDVLPDHGITAYRGRRPNPPPAGGRLARLARTAIDASVGSERTAVRPLREGPLWNLPATILFNVDTRPRTWRLWIRQTERRLDQAVRRRSLFHLWFHPHNFRQRPEESFAAFERLCRAAAEHRRAGRLDTVTMGHLAERLSAAQG